MIQAKHAFLLVIAFTQHSLGSQIIATFEYSASSSFTSTTPCTTFTATMAHAGIHPLGDVLLSPWPAPFLWSNGYTGSYDMTVALDFSPFDNFSRMIASITDGIDEPMFFDGSVEGCNQLLEHSPFILESAVFDTESDLTGNIIEFIRVNVNRLEIDQTQEITSYRVALGYEFWGSPVPEPASLALLALPLALSRRSHRNCPH